MRKLLLLFCFGLLTALGWGQDTSGKITATSATCGTNDASNTTACVVLPINKNSGSATVSVTGTYSGTLQFEVYLNGWVAINGFPPNSSTGASSTTSTGGWQFSVSAWSLIRVRCSSYSSGTATVVIQQAQPSASSGHGGGGSGTPGGSDTQAQFNDSGSFGGATNLLYNKISGQITANQKADTNETVYGARATDTTPTGNFINFQNAAVNAALFKVDVLGNVVAAGSIASGTAPAGVGTTATGGYAATETGTTGWTCSATSDFLRADSTAHGWQGCTNGGSWLNVPLIAGALSVASGKTLTVSNTMTLAGGDSTSITFPNAAAKAGWVFATGTSVSLTAPSQIYVCSSTCTVTPPAPAAGYQFCVFNGDNVSTVITLAALGSGNFYEATARTAYNTANQKFVSGGAVKDMICIVGLDSTHYITPNFIGTWTDTP